MDLGGTSRLVPAKYAAEFRSGVGRGPDLGLESKFVSKLTEAHVLGFCFQMHSEVRKEKAFNKNWEGGFIYVTVLLCRMLCRSSVELLLDVPSLMQATGKNSLFWRPFDFGLAFFYVYTF